MLSSLRRFRQGPSYSPNRLVGQSATLKEWSAQCCTRAKHKTYSPFDDYWVILPTSKAFHYFRAQRDEIRFAFDLPEFVDKITVEDWVCDSFRYKCTYSRNDIAPNMDRSSEYDLKNFPNVFRSLWYLLPCVNSFEVIWRFLERISSASTTSSKSN